MLYVFMVCEPCMYDVCIYHPRPLTLMHSCFMGICMMHIYRWSWSLILGHACKYDACIYNAAEILSRTYERTNEQGNSRSWIFKDLLHLNQIICQPQLFWFKFLVRGQRGVSLWLWKWIHSWGYTRSHSCFWWLPDQCQLVIYIYASLCRKWMNCLK